MRKVSIVADGFMTKAVGTLANATFGVFALPVAEHFGVASVGLAFGLFSLVHGVASPAVGLLVDRYGAAPIRRLGAVALMLGFVLAATAGTPVQFYIGVGVFAGFGNASFAGPALSVEVASAAPGTKLLPAFGLVTAGAGLGAVLAVPLSEAGIRNWGWAPVFAAYAATAVMVWLFSEFIRRSIRQRGGEKSRSTQRAIMADDVKHRPLWPEGRLILANAFSGAQRTLIVAFMIPWAIMHGIPSASAAGAFALAEGLRAFSGIIITRLGSGRGPRFTYAGSALGAAVGIAMTALLTPMFGATAMYAGMALYGMTAGGIWPSSTSFEVEVFRPTVRGALIGASTAAFGLGGAIGVATTRLLGTGRDAADTTIWLIVGAQVAVGALVLTVRSIASRTAVIRGSAEGCGK